MIATFCSFRWQNLAYVLIGRPVGWQKRQIQEWDTMKQNPTRYYMHTLVITSKTLKPSNTRHYQTHKITNNSNSFPQTRQGFFSHSCQIVHERQAVVIGETCWRCDSGIWGLEQARLNCQAEGRFTAVEQKLRDRIRPTHPTLRWFISVHRHKGPRKENEKHRGSLSAACPK